MLVNDLYLASVILSETILIANYQDGFTPGQPLSISQIRPTKINFTVDISSYFISFSQYLITVLSHKWE